MMPRRALVAAVALTLAGCGSGSSHSASQTTPSTPTTASVPTTATHPRSTPRKPRPQHRRSTTTTAPTPAGLRGSTGYGSYSNCGNTCTGSVPSALNRSLHLPSGCNPGGSGPVTPSPVSPLVARSFVGSPWSGARVNWTAASSYTGPVLIRGRQIGGSGTVGFGEGHAPVDALQFPAGGPRQWPSFTRVQSSGCYAYQVDGTSFSNVIVFRVTTSP